MNSNSLNILAGLALPSLFCDATVAHTAGGYLDTILLLIMTVAVVLLLAVGKGLNRKQGIALFFST